MKRSCKLAAGVAWGLASAGAVAAVPGPPRALTPSRAIVAPVDAKAAPVSIEALFGAAQSDSAAWSADGRSVFYTSDQGGQLAIWQVMADGRGAARRIGPSDLPQKNIVATADGRWLLFQSDIGGRQMHDVHALPVAGGAPVNLTATPDVDEAQIVPSPDGRFVAVARRTRTQSSSNLAVIDLATRAVRTLTDEKTEGVQWWPAAISGDGRVLLANRFDWGQTVGEAWLVEIASGKMRRLTPDGVYAEAGDITRDGRRASVTLEGAGGILGAATIDIASGAIARLPASDWDEKAGRFSPNGREMILVRNEDGRERVLLHDLATRRSRDLDLPDGLNSRAYHGPGVPAFSPDGKRLLFPHTSGAEPLAWWVRGMGKTAPMRVSQLGATGDAPLPPTRIVRYASSDGTIVSAILWLPFNLKRDGTAPAVVRPHGGPTGQALDSFDRTATALASRGYVVLAPNFRGSTGYGRPFLEANQRDLGGGDLEDVVAGARFLTEMGYVDARRIGIAGGSYGGYMTLMALAKTPDVWRAGVDMFGIVNWRTMWEHGTLANRRYQRTLIGDPATDPAEYDRASPLTYLDRVRAPLLVLQGENDPVVPASEARQVIARLDRPGRIVESHFYPEEGHGFARRENQIDSTSRTIDWFDRHLAHAPPVEGPAAATTQP